MSITEKKIDIQLKEKSDKILENISEIMEDNELLLFVKTEKAVRIISATTDRIEKIPALLKISTDELLEQIKKLV